MAFAIWNPADKSADITLSGGYLVATGTDTEVNQSVRGTEFKSSGKWYCEITCTSDEGAAGTVPRLGISTGSFGVSTDDLGETNQGYAYRKNGFLRFNAGTVGSGSVTWTTGDVISIVLDLDGGTLTFWKNGTPIADTFTSVSGTFAPTFHERGTSSMTANFGATAFVHTPPEGYSGWEEEVDPSIRASFGGMEMAGAGTDEFITPARLSGGGMEMAGSGVDVFVSPTRVSTGGMEMAGAGADTLVTVNFLTAELVYPAPVLALEGDSTNNVLALVVPVVETLFEVRSGSVASMHLTVPAPILALEGPSSLAISVPFSAAFDVVDGAVASLAITVPTPVFEATAVPENLLSFAASFGPRLAVTVLTGNVYDLQPISYRPRFEATVLSGADASLEITYPFSAAFSAFGPYEAEMALVYPSPVMSLGVTSELAAAVRTWVLNLRRKALTEYTNFGFNSYGQFRGTLLSAGDAGLFLHTGQDNDAGTPISARVRTGKESFGTSLNKRVPRIYASFRANGGMRFSTITSQGGERVYALPYNGLDQIQERRVPVGRGPKSPYWQFEMMNVDGADFLIEKLQPHPEKSHRRVV